MKIQLNKSAQQGDASTSPLPSSSSLPNLLVEFHLCQLIHKFECKYPSQFDASLNKLLAEDAHLSTNNNNNNSSSSQKQRNYFLATISCKFASFKCKSAFKHQQIKAPSKTPSSSTSSHTQASQLSLIVALNSPNESVRAASLAHILAELQQQQQQQPSSAAATIDSDFIREQLAAKLTHESSPLVFKAVLDFGTRLLDYVPAGELVTHLTNGRLFSLEMAIDTATTSASAGAGAQLDANDHSVEMQAQIEAHGERWLASRLAALHLVFNELFNDAKDKLGSTSPQEAIALFYNAFLLTASRLFELASPQLLHKLESSSFYTHMCDYSSSSSSSSSSPGTATGSTSASSTTPNKKRFYSTHTSSISITNMTTGATVVANGPPRVSAEARNELFEVFMQESVKYLLATSKQQQQPSSPKPTESSSSSSSSKHVIVAPECFVELKERVDTERHNAQRRVRLLDFVVFELCVRVSAQSLFITNAAHFLQMAASILVELVNPITSFAGASKKQESNALAQDTTTTNKQVRKINTLSAYSLLVQSQALTSAPLALALYQSLLRSLAIQLSNFANPHSRLEVNAILNKLYTSLCLSAHEHHAHAHALIDKLVESSCFSPARQLSPPGTPVKTAFVHVSLFTQFSEIADTKNHVPHEYLVEIDMKKQNL